MSNYLHFSPRTLAGYKRVQELLDQLHPTEEPRALLVPGSPQPRRGVIVFTGSFNPPTTAHLALLKQGRQYARQHEPMSLYAAMSKQTVDKENVERPLQLDRIMLLKRLLPRRVPDTGIMLFNRGLYVEQAQAIHRSFPRVKRILFLIGFDKIVQILDPHYYNDRDSALTDLFHEAELLVAPRGNEGEQELEALIHQPQNERFARFIHPLPFSKNYRQVSSTHVRQEARERAGHMQDVPEEVRRFIRETRAYAPPLRRSDGREIDYYGERMRQLNALLCSDSYPSAVRSGSGGR